MIKYYKNIEEDMLGRINVIHKVEGDEKYHADCLVFNPTYVDATEEEWIAQQPSANTLIKSQRINRYEEELPIGDQLDAIFKTFDAIATGSDIPAEALDIISKRKKIKEDLPYEYNV